MKIYLALTVSIIVLPVIMKLAIDILKIILEEGDYEYSVENTYCDCKLKDLVKYGCRCERRNS